ncbi:hypothetical protein Athai_37740 [Actinocatenispora thailandica]|uniref:HTH gntR-type domain-containing protein n=1 Tax=Actinocatenispora thailandica TaxID=227318 RepID=A0A7R7DRC6_9ACTN|nr:GntR family transcriptional regulator [Actinocatenispora thailandica]BCJ36271.1 hypothetical protein Athai_37740 [Actinocatenispora thailandica]
MEAVPDIEVPKWEQIALDVEKQIRSGAYQPGQRVMSENIIAQAYGVARGTARRAIAGLVEWGMVRVRPRQGVYAAPRESWRKPE